SEPAPNGFKVYLDRTAFYPASGGQPTDSGTIAGIQVLEAVDEGDEIAHILRQAPEAEGVRGKIDWARRFDHMQQHTGQHVLSAAFERIGEYKTVSFHLGEESSSIDLDSDRLGVRQLEEAEEAANQVVFENRAVRISFQPAGEASRLELRKPTSREGEVRLVEVEGFDLSACGGTHVSRTGAVGLILVRKVERMKGLTRVEFMCGGRAHRQARRDFRVLSEAARLFSAALDTVPELIAKQSQELREGIRGREKLLERLAEYQARELWQAAPLIDGRRVVRQAFPAEESAQAKMLAHALAKLPLAVALLGVKGKPTALFFAQTSGGPSEMGSILIQTVTKFGGKGGGGRDFAQGGGLEENRLEEALAYAQALVAGAPEAVKEL
ncbi:MAG: alanyl-tRNA editing protein, partial [Terriglobia bacterium]